MDFSELKGKVLSTIGKGMDSAKDLAGKGMEGAKDLTGKAAEKVKNGGRIARLSMDIATEKENMKKAYLEIGKLYYDTHKENPEGFFIQLCEEVALAEKNVAEKEAEIAALKSCVSEADIAVEFEEVVAETETAAECCCDSEKAADCCDSEKADDCGCGCGCDEGKDE